MNEHENEPVRGLPGRLPPGERLLWQGTPDWRSLALRSLHGRKLAIYFALLLAWFVASESSSGIAAASVARSTLTLAGLASIALGLIAFYAWLTARSTVYTLTDRRLVIHFGIALPASFNIPFARIEAAGLKVYPDTTGDIPLTLSGSERIGYLLLWPHVRPWRVARVEPMLRVVRDAERVAHTLSRALAASADLPARATIAEPIGTRTQTGPNPSAAAA